MLKTHWPVRFQHAGGAGSHFMGAENTRRQVAPSAHASSVQSDENVPAPHVVLTSKPKKLRLLHVETPDTSASKLASVQRCVIAIGACRLAYPAVVACTPASLDHRPVRAVQLGAGAGEGTAGPEGDGDALAEEDTKVTTARTPEKTYCMARRKVSFRVSEVRLGIVVSSQALG